MDEGGGDGSAWPRDACGRNCRGRPRPSLACRLRHHSWRATSTGLAGGGGLPGHGTVGAGGGGRAEVGC